MRKRISDDDIAAAIASLLGQDSRWADGFPCVRSVAEALRLKHGASGTNHRICAILRRLRASRSVELEPTHQGLSDVWRQRAGQLALELNQLRSDSAAKIAELEAQLERTLARAKLAEEREVAHQDYWADQICDLREQLRAAERQRTTGVDPDRYLDLWRELAAARQELATLKEGHPRNPSPQASPIS